MRGINTASIDCIATDPPFNAKRIFNAPLGSKAAGQRFDDRWRWDEVTDEWHDLIASEYPAIKEIIEASAVIEGGSIDNHTGKIDTGRTQNSIAAYLAWMAPRIIEMHRILKYTGVLFLQCNWEADSYLRLLLDAIFGRDKLINIIAWKCNPAKGNASRRLPRNHGTIFAYGKTGKWKWNPSYAPYDLKVLQEHYTDEEALLLSPEDQKTLNQYNRFEKGRRYQLTSLTSPSRNRPNLTYEFMGLTRVWRWTRERMQAAFESGLVVQTKPGNVPRFKRFLDEQPGRMRDDLWIDVMLPESSDSEWSTRKPISLYQRLIECATDPNDLILDPFAGCATTCVAAEYLNPSRKWVGIDIDPVAETETKRRLHEASGLFQGRVEPVTIKKSINRTDIARIPDGKLRQSLWNQQGRKCANPYCDSENLRVVDMHLDHRIPYIRGGEDDQTNRIALCGNCNSRKGKKAWGLFLDEERAKQPHLKVTDLSNNLY